MVSFGEPAGEPAEEGLAEPSVGSEPLQSAPPAAAAETDAALKAGEDTFVPARAVSSTKANDQKQGLREDLFDFVSVDALSQKDGLQGYTTKEIDTVRKNLGTLKKNYGFLDRVADAFKPAEEGSGFLGWLNKSMRQERTGQLDSFEVKLNSAAVRKSAARATKFMADAASASALASAERKARRKTKQAGGIRFNPDVAVRTTEESGATRDDTIDHKEFLKGEALNIIKLIHEEGLNTDNLLPLGNRVTNLKALYDLDENHELLKAMGALARGMGPQSTLLGQIETAIRALP